MEGSLGEDTRAAFTYVKKGHGVGLPLIRTERGSVGGNQGTISSLIKLSSQGSPRTTWISSGDGKLPVVADMHVETKWPLGQDFGGVGCP